jgi:hypothetical protein
MWRNRARRLWLELLREGVLAGAMAVGKAGVFFLNVTAVGQQDVAQVARAWRGVHPALKALAHQEGQIATAVSMRMGEQDGMDLLRRHGQGRPVAQPQPLVALEQSTFDPLALRTPLKQVFGTGDGVGCAQKGDCQAHASW